LSLERNRDRVRTVADEKTSADRAVRQQANYGDLTVPVDRWSAKVLECRAPRCDLIGDEHGCEVPALTAEKAEVGRPTCYLGNERHLPAIVDDRVVKGREPAARRMALSSRTTATVCVPSLRKIPWVAVEPLTLAP